MHHAIVLTTHIVEIVILHCNIKCHRVVTAAAATASLREKKNGNRVCDFSIRFDMACTHKNNNNHDNNRYGML